MDMTLAEALRVTATRIENGDYYDWEVPNDCNCGQLFKTIAGIKKNDLPFIFSYIPTHLSEFGVWSNLQYLPDAICPIAEVPIGSIIRTLREFGLNMIQVAELEHLSNLQIRKKAGLPIVPATHWSVSLPHRFGDFNKINAVIAYMRAWATMLDEQAASLCAVEVGELV